MIDAKIIELAKELDDIRKEILEHYCTINNMPSKENWQIISSTNPDNDYFLDTSPDAETVHEILCFLLPEIYPFTDEFLESIS